MIFRSILCILTFTHIIKNDCPRETGNIIIILLLFIHDILLLHAMLSSVLNSEFYFFPFNSVLFFSYLFHSNYRESQYLTLKPHQNIYTSIQYKSMLRYLLLIDISCSSISLMKTAKNMSDIKTRKYS